MYPPPRGHRLSSGTARELDNKLFSSDPFSYFTSRIASLLERLDNAASHGAEPVAGAAAARFDQMVGQIGPRHRASPERAIELQVAIDALALRHHAAETLLRFAYAMLRRRARTDGVDSVWADIADSPTQMNQVIAGIKEHLADEEARWDTFTALVFPADPGDDPTSSDDTSGVQTFAEWFNFALDLFEEPRSLDATAAHNKIKHGLGVRPQLDDLLFSAVGPDRDGNMPLSAVQSGQGFFDTTALEFLSRPAGRPKQGLEATQMRLDPVQLLAETALMAHEYAAIFCIAAHAHFAERDDAGDYSIATYPGLLIGGPLPEHVRPDRPVALRFPLTLRPDGGAPRPSVIIWGDGAVQEIHIGERFQGRIVDDEDSGDDST